MWVGVYLDVEPKFSITGGRKLMMRLWQCILLNAGVYYGQICIVGMEFTTEEVEYTCGMNGCGEQHTAEVVTDLPKDPLPKAVIRELSEESEMIDASVPGKFTTPSQTGEIISKYRGSHADIMGVVIDETVYLLRWIASIGWTVSEKSTLPEDALPEARATAVVEDYYMEAPQ